MPYYRRPRTMRRPVTRRPRKYARRTRALVPRPVRNYVRRAMDKKLEHKFVTTTQDEQAFSTLTAQYKVADLYVVGNGTGVAQRAGLKILPSGISIRGNLNYNATTASKTCYVRMLLIETSQAESYSGLTTEIFQNGSNWGNLASSQMPVIWAPLNRAGYKFHWDKVYKLNAQSTDGTYSRLVKKWIPIKGAIKFDGTSTGVGNQNRNFALVMLLAESGQDLATGETVEFSCFIRSYFTDA